MASQTKTNATDARQHEYTTYAPHGEKCRNCRKPFKSLETCRRVAIERASGVLRLTATNTMSARHDCPSEAHQRPCECLTGPGVSQPHR